MQPTLSKHPSKAHDDSLQPTVAYALLYPRLCETARLLGYALALHGSMKRDLDLIAVPWTEQAASAEELVEALRERVNGLFWEHDQNGSRLEKPHGRRVWAIHCETGGPDYLDVSVMPRDGNAIDRERARILAEHKGEQPCT